MWTTKWHEKEQEIDSFIVNFPDFVLNSCNGRIESNGGKAMIQMDPEIQGKQPWEMTEEQWETEIDRLRPNASGTGGDGPQMGPELSAAIDRILELRMHLPDVDVCPGMGMMRPANYDEMVAHAREQGLI